MGGVLRRVVVERAITKDGRRGLGVPRHLQVPGQRVPGLVRTGEADFEEEGTIGVVGLHPPDGGIADEDIGVETLLQMPGDALELRKPLRSVWLR